MAAVKPDTPWSAPDEAVIFLCAGLVGAFAGATLSKTYKESGHKDEVWLAMTFVIVLVLCWAAYNRFR